MLSKGLRDIFVAKYNANGDLQWVETAGGTGDDDVRGMSVSNTGDVIYFDGGYVGTATFGPDVLNGIAGLDFFISKLTQSPCSKPLADFKSTSNIHCSAKCFNLLNRSLGATTYLWYPVGTDLDSSHNVDLYDLCFKTYGTYPVVLIASNGTCVDTTTINIVYDAPATIIINRIGDTLYVANSYQYYQWNLNGSPISNATSNYYVTSQPGNYTVSLLDSNGCQVTSTPFIITGVEELSDKEVITIYPNPVTEVLNISGNIRSIELFDAVGQTLLRQEVEGRQHQLNLSSLSTGIYFIRVDGVGRGIPVVVN